MFLLSSQNVFEYLTVRGICDGESQSDSQIESKSCKNFNLLVHLADKRHFLIKQEPLDQNGSTHKDLLHEWQIHQLMKQSDLQSIRPLLSRMIDFNLEDSIAIFDYLTEYSDLDDFYHRRQSFPVVAAAALGATVAAVHQATLDREDYQRCLEPTVTNSDGEANEQVPDLLYGLEYLTYQQFAAASTDALKFYELVQRYESLIQAIAELNDAYEPCCLIHNDLKLNNILLLHDWETAAPATSLPLSLNLSQPLIRLIDWEKSVWGDPAADLGALIASYLKLWLKSLTVKAGIDLDLALRFATTPLEKLHPSLSALTQAYLAQFPQVLERFPDFLPRVMRFAGFELIEAIQAKLHYHEPFGNIEICMLQVAKTLLCTPTKSIPTVFGRDAAELLATDQVDRMDQVEQPEAIASTDERMLASVNPPVPISSIEPIAFKPPLPFEQSSILDDLVNHIQIYSNGWMVHANYGNSELFESSICLNQLPVNLQHQYLRMQLRDYLYDLYFSGEQVAVSISDSFTKLENNTLRGLHLPFYQQLEASNHGGGYFDPAWQVLRQKADGGRVLQKAGLTIHLQPEDCAHVLSELQDAVALRLPAGRIEAEFYIAVGNGGWVTEPALDLYFNVTPAGAIQLMDCFTEQLNHLAIPFSFKVLADPDAYNRLDAAVLQIAQHQYGMVYPVLQAIYPSVRSQLQPAVPLFTKPLAAGLGLAEEPESEPAEFGLNRLQWVAEALLSAWRAGDESPANRLRAIQHQFAQHGIDWQRPYLNPQRQDLYTALDGQEAKT